MRLRNIADQIRETGALAVHSVFLRWVCCAMLAGTLLGMLMHPWGWVDRREDAYSATRKIMQTWDDYLLQVEEEERRGVAPQPEEQKSGDQGGASLEE